MQQRFFKIKQKGLKGKNDTPFISLRTAEGESLTIHLEAKKDLDVYDIDDEFLIVVPGHREQKTLPETAGVPSSG